MKQFMSSILKCPGILPCIFAMVAGLLLTGMAQAGSLTSDQIQSFIDAGHDIENIEGEHPGLDQAADVQRDMTRPMSSALSALDDYPAFRSALAETVGEHGFDSIEEWANTGDRIIMAQLAITMQDMPPENQAMLEAMINSEDDQNMPAHMREQSRQMARQAKAMMAATDAVPEEDIQAVRPFMSQLDPEEY